jgi:pilus assembly protein CpaB
VVVLALILAVAATVGVFLYARGVKEEARTGGQLTTVVVSKVDIPANSDLNTYINEGQFVPLEIPVDAKVLNAVTSIDQLRDKRNSVPIFANEQIPTSRIQGEGQVPGGALGIPDGYQAMTVSLEAPRAVGGALFAGDNVTILATFRNVQLRKLNRQGLPLIPGVTGRARGAGAAAGGPGTTVSCQVCGFDTTVVLVPQAEVLRVLRPQVTTTRTGQTQQASGNVSVTLALTPEDTMRFVFAMEEGSVWLSLEPPGAEGVELNPLTIGQIVMPSAKPGK